MTAPHEFTPIEGTEGIFVLRSSGTTRGWNGIRYKTGLSAKNVNAQKLSMNVATIPPGGVAYAHVWLPFLRTDASIQWDGGDRNGILNPGGM